MGTTLTAALFHGEQMSICHVGDSRAYLYRDGRARQLTEDHSWIQEQIRAGLISPEDAIVSRFRNIITRSVGFEPDGRARPADVAGGAGRLPTALLGRPVELPRPRRRSPRC